tara:strand:- start:176 stop:574 length:399 start_codon:yes stop_codon:yes gene_type:complete
MTENTGKKREKVGKGVPPKEHQFKPGNKGRPKGSRNKLGEAFVADMLADWEKHGAKTIQKVREERPADYVKVVASILPKDVNVNVRPLEELTDDQLRQQAKQLIAELGPVAAFATGGDLTGTGKAKERKSLN